MMAAVAGMLFPLATQGMDRVGQVQLVLVYLVLSSFMGMVFRYIRLLITNDKDAMMPFLPSMIIGFILLLVRGKDLVAMMG